MVDALLEAPKSAFKSKRGNDLALDPALSFDEFVSRVRLSPVWREGLRLELTLHGGIAPRSLSAWNATLESYQTQV